jgi:hypothetical protein
MVNKILGFHADIGAAKNIAKNLCLLDESVHFPVSLRGLSRLDFLLRFLYPSDYKDWFSCEYVLKDYKAYGIKMDLGDVRVGGLIPLNPTLNAVLKQKHFTIDIMDHGTALDLSQCDHVNLLAIAPDTMFGLNWQIRAYTMKYGASRMFNFTFRDDNNIKKFIKKYGEQTWIDVNLCNFYDKVRQRRRILRVSGLQTIPLELIIWPNNWDELIGMLEKKFELNIPRDQAHCLLNQWMGLHWVTAETNDWEYRYVFKEFRPLDLAHQLGLCEEFENE